MTFYRTIIPHLKFDAYHRFRCTCFFAPMVTGSIQSKYRHRPPFHPPVTFPRSDLLLLVDELSSHPSMSGYRRGNKKPEFATIRAAGRHK